MLTQEECVNDANGGNTVGADVHLCVKSLSTAACNVSVGYVSLITMAVQYLCNESII